MTLYKATVVVYVDATDEQDAGTKVQTLLAQPPVNTLLDWHWLPAPGTPSGYVWPEPAKPSDLQETSIAPECGHSVCSQNFIDEGEPWCLDKEPHEDLPDTDYPADDLNRQRESLSVRR